MNKRTAKRIRFYYEKLKQEKFKQAVKALPMFEIKPIKRVRIKP